MQGSVRCTLAVLLSLLCYAHAISNVEQTYLTLTSGAQAKTFLQYYTSRPHLAGSLFDFQTANYTLTKFLEFGMDAHIEEFTVVLTEPISTSLQWQITNGTSWTQANLTEPVVPVDPTSNTTDPSVMTYNGFSASGNVTAEVIYANYGRLQDFQLLQENGINVTGKIILVRYGMVFRGVKVMIAQQYGAAGVLIYSDPADDGFGRGEVYPEGPWRPEYGVQRGSVQFLPICPGSPSASRLMACVGREDVNVTGTLITNIPVLPISWGNALGLFQNMTGDKVIDSWAGGLNVTNDGNITLNVTYRYGPGVTVNLNVLMNNTERTIWNVIGTIQGSNPTQTVLIGNHRDAWVFGATDPSSGSAAMLEVARSLSVLRNTTSWVPLRNITFCSWDAEEQGLMGSVAWGEAHASRLQDTVVAYVNTDVGVGGIYWDAGGTSSLNSLFLNVSSEIPYNSSLGKTLRDWWPFEQIRPLGSGSDYTVFLDYLGIPSIDVGFEGVSSGVYHSLYDSFYWMENFGDPNFTLHNTLAQFLGVFLIRLATSSSLPYNYTNYGQQIETYYQVLVNNTNDVSPTPNLSLTNLNTAIAQFTQSGIEIDQESACSINKCADDVDVPHLNARLMFAERRFLVGNYNGSINISAGLPNRPWFKHILQAPGLYSGYGSDTFPSIIEAIRDQNWTLAQSQVDLATTLIIDAATALQRVTVQTTDVTLPKCFGDRGLVNLNVSGGFSPVVLSVNGSANHEGSVVNATAGTYVITATDSFGFVSSVMYTITQPQAITITKTEEGEKTVKIQATGGAENFTFAWSNGAKTPAFTADDYGTYTVVATDQNGCSATLSVTFTKKSNGGMIAGIIIAIFVVVGIAVGGVFYYRRRNARREASLTYNLLGDRKYA